MHRASVRAITALLALTAGLALAQDGTIPHTFESGDVIRASEMNENFQALEDAIMGESSPTEGFISVPPYAFRPQHANDANFRGAGFGQGGACGALMAAPLRLPHGATITSVTFYYEDIDATADIQLSLDQFDPLSGSTPHSNVATITSTGTPGITSTTVDSGLAEATVDNERYGYVLMVNSADWTCEIQARGATIGYDLP